ncbi:hypothetical protein BGZ61DRAFT_159103 [Ilyonectria robusta]|uniref:uncharacterized protein n=1 Tax=Ilyonectria robusta TaxID=1079257 RepID=UPI001E8E6A59|nr:uncharacterized protein BGZ61DRAFT_159103 [Ilyonectria robusta]KAH8733416.1 hypothetical protein BGZ61DRAFT_159103 [Ilyonectria robusta]
MSRVFKAASLCAPHNHHASFVEASADGSGTFLQVMGGIYHGMGFEEKTTECLEESLELIDKTLLGLVMGHNHHAMKALERDIQRFPDRVPLNHDNGERRGLANQP